ncbi:hypothetical protein ACP4OV_003482 [Aristida adscensionis]
MAPVECPADDLQKLRIAGDSDIKSDKRKPRPDLYQWGDDICAVCDNGGDVTCCEGGCQRSFHLSDKYSEESECRSVLGLTKEQAEIIINSDEDLICKNCEYKQHQCFACGSLGSSDLSSGAEVFQCGEDECGHFYHPKCVAELLYPDNEEAIHFELEVAIGEKFSCPVHECILCKEGEDKNDKDMQFAECRRCPTTYHRKCLPSDMHFETKKGRNGYMRRVWDMWEEPDGDICDQILIYCLKHEIIRELGTPEKNHIIFPDAKKGSVHEGRPMEGDITEHEPLAEHPPSELPPAGNAQNECCCSSPINSFAPKSLFTDPHPGNYGWLGD